MIKNYRRAVKSDWSGRVDSYENYDAFRWHQWVEIIDLNEDVKKFDGKLGIAFLGFECDSGIDINKGRIGASAGPSAIRKSMSKFPCRFQQDLKLFDAGNIYVYNLSLDEAQNELGKAVKKLLELNYFPIVLGGGHETALGNYKGIFNFAKEREKNFDIGIISFDAHFDTRPYKENGASSGTMFRQIYDLNKENGINYSYLVMGIQNSANTVELFKFAKEKNVKYILAKDMVREEIYRIFEQIDEFIKGKDYIYVTICSDVFMASHAPGVSAPQPLGIDPEQCLVLLKHILSYEKTVSMDIAEVSPRFDKDNATASLAAIIIYTIVMKLADLKNLYLEI